MKTSLQSVLQSADLFFMHQSPLHEAARRICKTLDDMAIPFAIAGALAVNIYGHERMTADLDLLMSRDDLQRFKDEWLGRGWVEKFAGSKGMRDAILNVPIDVLLVGDYPGDGLPKPVSFPDPSQSVIRIDDGTPVLKLRDLIELKLASGMTSPDRPRDLDDVIQLIRKNDLARDFEAELNPYVHEAWRRLWDASRIRDDY